MIKTFATKDTAAIFVQEPVRRFSRDLAQTARRKLLMLHHARCLEDLRIPPGNRLERLSGNREGQYSIRINNQWRLCFDWLDGDAWNVEIVDYH